MIEPARLHGPTCGQWQWQWQWQSGNSVTGYQACSGGGKENKLEPPNAKSITATN
jgi:hypothetical protein